MRQTAVVLAVASLGFAFDARAQEPDREQVKQFLEFLAEGFADMKPSKGPVLDVPDDEPGIGRKFELAELRQRIERALENLPGPLRELFVWRHINELSYEEMAEIKGLPVGTIKNRVFQAKEMLRRTLQEMS